jgi:hypothetical protein
MQNDEQEKILAEQEALIAQMRRMLYPQGEPGSGWLQYVCRPAPWHGHAVGIEPDPPPPATRHLRLVKTDIP